MQGIVTIGDEVAWQDAGNRTHYGTVVAVSDDANWADVQEGDEVVQQPTHILVVLD